MLKDQMIVCASIIINPCKGIEKLLVSMLNLEKPIFEEAVGSLTELKYQNCGLYNFGGLRIRFRSLTEFPHF